VGQAASTANGVKMFVMGFRSLPEKALG